MASSGDSSAGKPPFLAFATDAKDIESLKAFAAAHQWPESCIHKGDITTAAQFLKDHPSPALLLIELSSAEAAPTQLDTLAEVCDPGTKVITTGSVNEYSFYCWLMDLGIFSYLLRPLTEPMLEAALIKANDINGSNKSGRPPGKVIAVTGTRGGVGSTTIAINLAGIFADSTRKNIALVDVDPQEGSVALALDIEPSRGLRDALERPDRIDSLFMERVMNKPRANLSVLSAEEALQERINVHESASETLLKELKGKFDIVVLDIPRYLNPFSSACLKQADAVVQVTELTLLSLRDSLRVSDLMRDSLRMKPPVIVASRVGAAPKQEMQLADFEKGINAKVAVQIPYAPELFMPISSEIPSIKHKASPQMKPLYQLAQQLVPEAKARKSEADKKSFSLFKKKAKG